MVEEHGLQPTYGLGLTAGALEDALAVRHPLNKLGYGEARGARSIKIFLLCPY